jgi:hypothetical protein
VTVAGTVAVALLLDSDTDAPPSGAAAVSVTVPVTADPPTTELADSVTDDNAGVTDVGEVDELDVDPPHPAIINDAATTTQRYIQI